MARSQICLNFKRRLIYPTTVRWFVRRINASTLADRAQYRHTCGASVSGANQVKSAFHRMELAGADDMDGKPARVSFREKANQTSYNSSLLRSFPPSLLSFRVESRNLSIYSKSAMNRTCKRTGGFSP